LSEPALVGVITADGTFTARYLHWAGNSTDTVAALRAIWTDHFGRDTTATVSALLSHDWYSLCPACKHRRPPATTTVTGVGHALVEAQPPVRGNVATAARHGYTEWMYLIDAEARTIRVYEATVHDRWLPHSLHPLDAATALAPPGGRYRRGDRVVLEHTNDPHTQLRPGDQGTVAFDQRESSTVSIVWDSGFSLAMLLDAGDRIRLLNPSPEATTRPGEGR
jgi:hypothetical protein